VLLQPNFDSTATARLKAMPLRNRQFGKLLPARFRLGTVRYSSRNATIGSNFAARCAGSELAATATIASSRIAPSSVRGS